MLQEDLRQKSFLIHQKDAQLDHYWNQLEQKDEELRQRSVELGALQREIQMLQVCKISYKYYNTY